MKKLLSIVLLIFAPTIVTTQTADQPARDDRGASTPATRGDDSNRSSWGWLGLIGLAGLGGFAGRNRRRDVIDRDRDRNVSDIRRAA